MDPETFLVEAVQHFEASEHVLSATTVANAIEAEQLAERLREVYADHQPLSINIVPEGRHECR